MSFLQFITDTSESLVALTELAAEDNSEDPTINVPDPDPEAPPGMQEAANTFLGWLKWGGMAAGMAGLIICGIMMAVGRKNRSNMAVEGATGIPWVLGGLSLIMLAAGIVGAVLGSNS